MLIIDYRFGQGSLPTPHYPWIKICCSGETEPSRLFRDPNRKDKETCLSWWMSKLPALQSGCPLWQAWWNTAPLVIDLLWVLLQIVLTDLDIGMALGSLRLCLTVARSPQHVIFWWPVFEGYVSFFYGCKCPWAYRKLSFQSGLSRLSVICLTRTRTRPCLDPEPMEIRSFWRKFSVLSFVEGWKEPQKAPTNGTVGISILNFRQADNPIGRTASPFLNHGLVRLKSWSVHVAVEATWTLCDGGAEGNKRGVQAPDPHQCV